MFQYLKGLFSKNNERQKTAPSKLCVTASEIFAETDRVGYCIVPLMDEQAHHAFYEESLAFLEEVKKHDDLKSFISIGRLQDPAIRNRSNEIIKKYLKPALDKLLDPKQFEVIYGVHLLKSNTEQGVLNPHQDSSHVDELSYSTYHVWIPITPPSKGFGTLEVIPFSHKLQIPYRSLNIPWALSKQEMHLWKYMQKVELKAGQVVIFNSKLLHASGPNKTGQVRIAANSLIKPVAADFIHCYSEKSTNFKEIELYKIDPEFYYKENIMERPRNYPLLKKVPNTNKTYSIKELEYLFYELDKKINEPD
jgi:hypothetical protein